MRGRTSGGNGAGNAVDGGTARAGVSEARFHALADSAPVGVLYTDLDGEISYANERWLQITGLTRAGLRPDADRLLHPHDRDRVVHTFREALRAGREGTVEYRIVRDDGDTRWINSRAAPVFADDGVVGFVASATDVTDEVEARRSIDWVGQILAATPDYTVITNSHGGTLCMNQASRDLYGLAADAPLHDFDWARHLPEWARDKVEKEVYPALLDEGIWMGVLALLDRAGREVPISSVTVAHDAADGAGRWFLGPGARARA